MRYSIYRQSKTTIGDDEDQWANIKASLVLVSETEEEEYAEWCAEQYGSQDNSNRFDSKRICEFASEDEMKEAVKLINETLVINNL